MLEVSLLLHGCVHCLDMVGLAGVFGIVSCPKTLCAGPFTLSVYGKFNGHVHLSGNLAESKYQIRDSRKYRSTSYAVQVY